MKLKMTETMMVVAMTAILLLQNVASAQMTWIVQSPAGHRQLDP
jgi:hypothetical protein